MAGHTIGRETETGTGTLTQVFANPTGIRPKVGGVSIDWSKVTAVSGADVTLSDGTVIPIGKKYLRFGELIAKITQVEINTVTISATGGTFTISITAWGVTQTTSALAYNAAQAVVQAALDALSIVNTNGGVTVGKASAVYTLTFAEGMGNVTVATDASALTGGSGTAAVVVSTQGDAHAGWYGPYDATATDGRQNRNRGAIYFINRTVLEDDDMSIHPPAFEGGTLFKARMNLGSSPLMTLAQFETAFPDVKWVSAAN